MINFNEYELRSATYLGSDEKRSMMINQKFYMLKLPDKLENENKPLLTSYVNTAMSESIGCRIFESAGIPAQKTIIGNYDGKPAIACEDFILNSSGRWTELANFSGLENSMFSSSQLAKSPKLENVEKVFSNHPYLEKIRSNARDRFWDTFVVDGLIANPDRHSGNWGYLNNPFTKEFALAPVYDCGSSLFAKLSEDNFESVLSSPTERGQRLHNAPYPSLLVSGKKISYYDFMVRLPSTDLKVAIQRIVPRIDLLKIKEIIRDTENITKSRVNFLSEMVDDRYNKMLVPAYEKVMESIEDMVDEAEKEIDAVEPEPALKKRGR